MAKTPAHQKDWMEHVHPKKGALHRQLHIRGPISDAELVKAEHSGNKLEEERARLAMAYRHANHHHGKR